MNIEKSEYWIYYIGDDSKFEHDKVGKWLYFFENKEFVEKICKEAVENRIVNEAKHSNAETGVSCFYLNIDDIENHKRVIEFFIKNNLIRKTKSGRYYNISFKLDTQTLAREYGENYNSEVKLDKFIDLNTGEWKI